MLRSSTSHHTHPDFEFERIESIHSTENGDDDDSKTGFRSKSFINSLHLRSTRIRLFINRISNSRAYKFYFIPIIFSLIFVLLLFEAIHHSTTRSQSITAPNIYSHRLPRSVFTTSKSKAYQEIMPSHRNAAKILYKRLFNPKSPACSNTLLFRDFKSNGFGAQMLRVLNAYILSKALRTVFIIESTTLVNYGCGHHRGWNCYFSMPNQDCELSNGSLFSIPSNWTLSKDVQVYYDGLKSVEESAYSLKSVSCALLKQFPRTEHFGRADSAWCGVIGDDLSEELAHLVVSNGGEGWYNSSEKVEMKEKLILLRKWMNELWKPREKIDFVIQKEMNRLKIPTYSGSKVIGVHVRRGDKRKEIDFIPIHDYISAVKRFVDEFQRDNSTESIQIYVASDEFEAVTEFISAWQRISDVSVTSAAVTDRIGGHNQEKSNKEHKFDRSIHTLELLLDISILRKSDIFICTLSSNLARMIHVLRNDKDPETTISLDVAWRPGVAFRSYGTEYCVDDRLCNALYCNSG